jgi:hypothetical protein
MRSEAGEIDVRQRLITSEPCEAHRLVLAAKQEMPVAFIQGAFNRAADRHVASCEEFEARHIPPLDTGPVRERHDSYDWVTL